MHESVSGDIIVHPRNMLQWQQTQLPVKNRVVDEGDDALWPKKTNISS